MIDKAQADEDDLALLRELSLNGRESLTRLSRKLGLSKQRLGYRLRSLERRGLLTGFFAIPNIFRLGFDHFRVFVRFQRLTEMGEKELLDHLLNRSDVSWLTQLDGDFDLEFVVWAQGVPAFESAYDDILGQFGGLFQEKYFSLATRIEFLPWRFLTPAVAASEALSAGASGVTLESLPGPLEVDAIDRRLLAELSRNGRLSLASLSRRCRVSPAAAAQHLRALKSRGAIAGFAAKIDHARLGFVYRKVFLRLEGPAGEALARLCAWLRSRPEVIFLVKTIGSWDLEVELMTGPGDEFLAFMRRLRTGFAADVAAFRSVIVLRELKYGQYPA